MYTASIQPECQIELPESEDEKEIGNNNDVSKISLEDELLSSDSSFDNQRIINNLQNSFQ